MSGSVTVANVVNPESIISGENTERKGCNATRLPANPQ